MDDGGLYEVRNFCKRQAGKLWSAFIFVRGDEFCEVSFEDAREFAQTLNDDALIQPAFRSITAQNQLCLIAVLAKLFY